NDAILRELLESIRIDHMEKIKDANFTFSSHFPLLSSLSEFFQIGQNSESLLILFTPLESTFLGSVVTFQSLKTYSSGPYLLLTDTNMSVFPRVLNMFCNGHTTASLLMVLCLSDPTTVSQCIDEGK